MKNLIRIVLTLLGFALGPGVVAAVYSILSSFGAGNLYDLLAPWANIVIFCAASLVTGIIFLIFMRRMMEALTGFTSRVESGVAKMSGTKLLFAILGFVTGLLIAWILSWPISQIPVLSIPISIVVYIVSLSLCMRIFIKNSSRMLNAIRDLNHSRKNRSEKASYDGEVFGAKILDTSAIIDGRIYDICKTGIVEGTLVIPEFVLDELRHIADSPDNMKRAKGRRGLDMINKMQNDLSVSVEITDADYEEVSEVDVKLLRLAKDLSGKVITTDFNLNKVASVQGVPVFNINDLSNAIKPVLLPGEALTVTVVSEGKEQGQGLAYLEDGTMIVVENGRDYIGKKIPITVTSVLQTSAGRMIFARP